MHRLSARSVWYAYEAADSFLGMLAFTVTAVYYVTEVGMSPLHLVLVGTLMEVSIFVFEVPTGIVADMYSRRLSIVIGTFVMGVAVMLFGALGDVWPILAANALWGFGYTFTSGAFDAWLADEVGQERLAGVYLRGAQVGRVASLAGIGASVGLALVDLRLPIVAAGAGGVLLALFFALAMPETGFAPLPREERGSFAQMAHTGGQGARLVRARPVLLAILGIAAFAGMWSEGYDRLWQAHFIRDIGLPSIGGLDPVVWFGVFGAGTILLSIAVAHPLGKRIERAGLATMATALFWIDAALLVSALVFGLAGQFWLALVAYFAVGLGRNVGNPIFQTWLNRSVEESGVRATVLSITNQADAVGQWTGGPAIGLVGNAFSIRAALSVGALCMAPALALYRRAARHQGEVM
jgi:DHA3 family tetracycline resistance protein-like MFS transporter